MNIYGKAMTGSKRQAHSNVVEMVLNGKNPSAVETRETLAAAIGN
jgi:hypothetical protein